jgi:hypothetical protein
MKSKDIDLRNGLPYGIKPGKPTLLTAADQRVVTVGVAGDPSVVSGRVLGPLYATAYAIRKGSKARGQEFPVEKLRGRWPDRVFGLAKSQWTGTYALPVPDDVDRLPQLRPEKAVPGVEVVLTRWGYGQLGAILHVGGFESEGPTIQALHAFVIERGLRVLPDSHEEVYLNDPKKTPKERLKTLILCRVSG